MTSDYDFGAAVLVVNVYQRGHLVTRVRCETAQEAADEAARWEERKGFAS